MVKDTSLLIGDPGDHRAVLPGSSRSATGTSRSSPAWWPPCLWYLIVCCVLMVGQSCLERYFGRGFGTSGPGRTTGMNARTDAPRWSRGTHDHVSQHPARADGCRSCTRSTSPSRSTATRCSRASTSTSPPARWSACSGPPGSGKTTFLRCINQLETIHGGRIWVDGDLARVRRDTAASCTGSRRQGRSPRQRREIGMVLPAVQPVPAHDRAGERHGGAGPGQRRQQGGRQGAGAELLDRVGLWRPADDLPGPALRRPAAAGRDRPGAGDGPQADALRRAHLGARPGAGGRGAQRDARARRRAA